MRRPVHLLPALLLLLLATACTSMGVMSAWLNDQVTFTAPQLQRQLDARFPRSFDTLGGLASVTLAAPRLSMLRGESRLRLDFDFSIDGVVGDDRPGHLVLVSGLRYDPATRGLHLDDPALLQFDLPGSGALVKGGSQGMLDSLLADYARREPVYRLDEELLSKLPTGKRIASVDIVDGRVVVGLGR